MRAARRATRRVQLLEDRQRGFEDGVEGAEARADYGNDSERFCAYQDGRERGERAAKAILRRWRETVAANISATMRRSHGGDRPESFVRPQRP